MTNCRFENVICQLSGDCTHLNTPSLDLNEGGAVSSRLEKDRPEKDGLKKKSKKPAKSILKNLFPLNCSPIIEPNKVEIFLNLRTISETNNFDHWTKKHKRHKKQKNILFWAFQEVREFVRLPCKIKYIRYAPKELDSFENLPTSFKYLNDALCAEITGDHRPGRADGDKRITLSADQVKSKNYGVKIIIEF